MIFEQYNCKIKEKLEKSFELQENYKLGEMSVDLFGYYQAEMGRTMVTKVDIIDKYEINEKCYLKYFTNCNEEVVMDYFNLLVEEVKKVETSHYHMYTDIVGVMVFDEFDSDLIKMIKKLKYGQLFKCYFRGFGDVNFLCVDLKNEKVYSNRIARRFKKVYKVW